MIISASRRTDIPAFYTEWFIDKLKKGWMIVINPYNPKQANLVPINGYDAEFYVFWTKNPKPMLDRIDEIIELIGPDSFYFQFTVNAYGTDVEPNLPPLQERIETFQQLSKRIGKERVIWRYDPILLTDFYTLDWHERTFKALTEKLHDYTEKCVFSFVDPYKKTLQNTKIIDIGNPSNYPELEIAESLSNISKQYDLKLSTCCEAIDLEKYGITHNKCIDDELIKRISGLNIDYKKDGQRAKCGCVKCRDIGANNTCLHNCVYCYANNRSHTAEEIQIDPKSPVLGKYNLNHFYNGHNDGIPIYFDGNIITDVESLVQSRKHLKRKRTKQMTF